MNGLFARVRSYWRALREPDRLGAEMDEEMRFHLDLEAERLVRERGLEPREARRRAAIAFGGVERYKEAGRDVRGVTWANGLSLDLKLAWRMLRKSPGLTVVGVLGIALGTSVGIGFFVFLSTFYYPTLPLEEGDRIVALANWDVEANEAVPSSLEHFVTWRGEMRSVEQVAAAAMGHRALVTGDAAPQTVRAAEMTAASFQIARVPPLVGRYLVPEDERAEAARVAVIGYDLWQARFAGDPEVVGRRVLVGGVEHSIVGVMPPGFALPQSEELWTALRASQGLTDRGDGAELFVFGRLAPGVTREQAQAELTTIGRRAAAASPETNGRLRPRVLPYTYPLQNMDDAGLWEAAQIQLMVNLLLLAIAVNIAVLVYARTAMRQGEIAVRTALGASRRRIVAQLFVEAIVLATLGTALGLASAHVVLGQANALLGSQGIAFWVDYGLQRRSVVFAVALAIFAAVIIGVVPGLKATGRRLIADLRRLGSGASVRLGWGWTAMIVVQVAVAVAVLPTAVHLGFNEMRRAAVRSTFPAHEFLTTGIAVALPLRPGMDGEDYRREAAARFAHRLPELERRMEAEPAVAGVTFEGRLPGRGQLVEVEGVMGPEASGGHRVVSSGVAVDYFELLGARVLAGRDLRASDAGESGGGVVVSDAFAREVLGGGSALGRRVRFLPEPATGRDAERLVPGPWLEIVGVVQDLQASVLDRTVAPAMAYYPVAPGELQAVSLLVRIRGIDADRFAPRLRQVTGTVDSELRLGPVENLATVRNPRYLTLAVAILTLVLTTVTLLSAVGIHALMSLTVTRRRREIGIRTALGAHPGRLLATIFSRAAGQLGLGGLLGSLVGGAILLNSRLTVREAAIYLGGVVTVMLMAGLVAAVGPARRGLRIQPLEALREE